MPGNILIVDDSLSIRLVVRSTLERHGHAVTEAPDAPAALVKIAALDALDLLITDLNMPKMNGVELIEVVRMRSPFPTVPILVVSTEIHNPLAREALAGGADDLLPKPFTPEDLLERVGRLLGAGR